MPRPRKSFGQHWLKDGSVHNAIIQAAQLTPETHVLEVGPGTGQLTRRLLNAAGHVTAIELDRDLHRILVKKFAPKEHLTLILADFLELPLPPEPTVVVANIPYNITSPILDRLLGRLMAPVLQFERIVLLLQKEVADRLVAAPGSKTYGALSVRSQLLAECTWVCDVPPRAFVPPPKVTSSVVRLVPKLWSPAPDSWQHLDRLIRLGFSTRRKTLANTLQSALAKEHTYAILTELGLPPQARAETLSVAQWVAFSDATAQFPAVISGQTDEASAAIALVPGDEGHPGDQIL